MEAVGVSNFVSLFIGGEEQEFCRLPSRFGRNPTSKSVLLGIGWIMAVGFLAMAVILLSSLAVVGVTKVYFLFLLFPLMGSGLSFFYYFRVEKRHFDRMRLEAEMSKVADSFFGGIGQLDFMPIT